MTNATQKIFKANRQLALVARCFQDITLTMIFINNILSKLCTKNYT